MINFFSVHRQMELTLRELAHPLTIKVDMKPKQAERQRTNFKERRFHNDEDYEKWSEDLAKSIAFSNVYKNKADFDEMVCVAVDSLCVFKAPMMIPKDAFEETGWVLKGSKPDWDNLAKANLDALVKSGMLKDDYYPSLGETIKIFTPEEEWVGMVLWFVSKYQLENTPWLAHHNKKFKKIKGTGIYVDPKIGLRKNIIFH